MNRVDLVGEAVRALAAHRLRASLSALGIVCGVATVVAALAIGEGARREAFEDIGSLGINNVFIRAAHPAPGAARKAPAAPELTVGDARAIASLPDVEAVSGVRTTLTEVSNGSRHQMSVMAGVTSAWARIGEPRLAAGRLLTDRDITDARRVLVMGAGIAIALFGHDDPIGRHVRAAGDWYLVVGTLGAPGGGRGKPRAVARLDLDASVLVPLTAMDLRLGDGDDGRRLEEVAVATRGPGAVAHVAAAIDARLRRRHDTRADWEIVVPRELLDARLRAERVFNAVLIGIGGLALFISGIGIMNIMLASVAERTQEIGVRRAFGARATDVTAQFAVEASLLALGGGIVGVPAGVALASLVALLAGWPVTISATSVCLALAVATSVGLSFGVYPARVAARIQPIDALRAP